LIGMALVNLEPDAALRPENSITGPRALRPPGLSLRDAPDGVRVADHDGPPISGVGPDRVAVVWPPDLDISSEALARTDQPRPSTDANLWERRPRRDRVSSRATSGRRCIAPRPPGMVGVQGVQEQSPVRAALPRRFVGRKLDSPVKILGTQGTLAARRPIVRYPHTAAGPRSEPVRPGVKTVAQGIRCMGHLIGCMSVQRLTDRPIVYRESRAGSARCRGPKLGGQVLLLTERVVWE
jgi:hypothetical protein